MGVLRNIFGQHSPGSPDSVTFDASGYDFQGEQDGARVWFLPDSGGVGLYFFPLEPDWPRQATSIRQLRDFLAAQAGDVQVVECRVVSLDEVQSTWVIVKELDEKKGATYVGSLTIPFRDFSFVIKVQCCEQECSGMREVVVMAEALQKGTGWIEDGVFVPDGWSFDDEQFDDRLPEHPLSRVRSELRHIAASVQIEPEVKDEPRFELPQGDT